MRSLAALMLGLTPCMAMAASNPADTVPFEHWAYDPDVPRLSTLPPPGPDATQTEWAWWVVRYTDYWLATEDVPNPRGISIPYPPAMAPDTAKALTGLLRRFWPEIEALGAADRLASELRSLPKGHWLHEEAGVLLAEIGKSESEPVTGQFPDVPEGHWAYYAVLKLKRAGILIGYPPGGGEGPVFGGSPDGPITPTNPAETVPFD